MKFVENETNFTTNHYDFEIVVQQFETVNKQTQRRTNQQHQLTNQLLAARNEKRIVLFFPQNTVQACFLQSRYFFTTYFKEYCSRTVVVYDKFYCKNSLVQ
ncbi:hypothetical protein T4D_13935 [Trichinella pseudospiralis]|uniref:Uncharacterized protein n=1 Tax=Trichinella pseudospiralis TaxID=6337 RepID=A0A0V1FGG5_TRIPS|nr:hypothetical protein T4D_13935 [Trichinella pseudospiralis]